MLQLINFGDYNLEFLGRKYDYLKLLSFAGMVPVNALRGLRARAHELLGRQVARMWDQLRCCWLVVSCDSIGNYLKKGATS